MEIALKDLITDKISGEWGIEATTGEGVKILRTTNFTNLGRIDFENVVIRNVDERKVNQKKLLKGDIIIEKSGGSPNQPVGRVVFFDLDTNEDYLCNNFTTILRPDSTKVYPKFLFYQLFIGHIRGRTLKYQNKTTGIINLKLDNYLEELVFVPSILDQMRIATVLSKVEEMVAKRKESIGFLDDFLKSTFIKMFGDPVINEKGWETKALESITTKITDGKHGDCENETDSGYYFISAKDLVDGKIKYEGVREITKKDFEETHRRTQLKLNDILIGNTGASIGKIAIVDNEEKANRTTFQKSIAIVTVDNVNITPKFLMAYLIPNRDYLEKISTGSGQKNLLLSQLRSLKLIIPPIKLQNKFVSIVEKSEIIKSQYQESLKELENLFGSLCHKAFKNELDVANVTIEEEWHYADGNEPEEKDPVKRAEIKKYFDNEIKKIRDGEYDYLDKRYGDPFDVDEETAKKTGKQFYKDWKKLHKIKPKSKITWDKVSTQQVANWVKEKYLGYHFTSEMLIRFLMDEYITFPNYYSSEELKKYPKTNEADDLKTLIQSAIVLDKSNKDELDKANSFIKLEQLFYNAEKENIQLKITEEDYEFIKDRSAKERSGIYFSIIE